MNMKFDDEYVLEEYCTMFNYPIDATKLKNLLGRWRHAGDDRQCQEDVIAEALVWLPATVSHVVVREWRTEVSEDERRGIVRDVLVELAFKDSQGFFQEHAGTVTYGEYLEGPYEYGENALDRLRKATHEPGAPVEITFDWDQTLLSPEWLIPGWLPARRVAILTGEGGWGESSLALQLWQQPWRREIQHGSKAVPRQPNLKASWCG